MGPSVLRAARFAAALSGLVTRRGYSAAAAPSSAARRMEEKAVAASAKRSKTTSGAAAADSSWVPDPVTGYYRPANRTADVDAAELRRRLLSRESHH